MNVPYAMTLAQAQLLLERQLPDGTCTAVGACGEPLALSVGDHEHAGPVFTDVTFDSRAAGQGSLFVCKGSTFRPSYLADAVARGACAYLAERAYPEAGVPGLVVSDVRKAMARLAVAFFGNPSGDMRVVGITGTKGKTTVAYYVDAILRARGGGARSALLTGVVIDDGQTRRHAQNTTPEAVELQRHLAVARDAGCDVAVMEASSQGFKYDRTLGTRFAVGVFTNIGEDHISPIEHPTFEDYFSSKLRIFDQSDVAVVNAQSDHAPRVLKAAGRCRRLITYGLEPTGPDGAACDVFPLSRQRVGEGRWRMEVATPSGPLALEIDALGDFNVSNALAAVAVAQGLGLDHECVARGLAHVHVPGRMERYDSPDGSIVGIIDYAHNEMSMRALLGSAREEFPGREVTVVFGSCGTRGFDRRAGLGRVAGSLADRVILTEDDPGPVDVRSICEEIGASVREAGGTYDIICERPRAVHEAIASAHAPAVVLLAGKGAECDILRAEGRVPCKPDAQLFCDEVGIRFGGYADIA